MSPKPDAITTDNTRCQHMTADGRRCRAARLSGKSVFCTSHSQQEQQYINSKSVAAELIGDLDDFRTYHAANAVLGKLLILVAQNRIPLRNATALAYICQLLLTSNLGVRNETALRSGKAGELFIVERALDQIYGPDEDDEPEEKETEAKPVSTQPPQQKAS